MKSISLFFRYLGQFIEKELRSLSGQLIACLLVVGLFFILLSILFERVDAYKIWRGFKIFSVAYFIFAVLISAYGCVSCRGESCLGIGSLVALVIVIWVAILLLVLIAGGISRIVKR